MSRIVFAATELRAVIQTLKAAVAVMAFVALSLISNSEVLANTSLEYGRQVDHVNLLSVSKALPEAIQDIQLNVRQNVRLGVIDYDLSQSEQRSPILAYISYQNDKRLVSNFNLRVQKVLLANLANSDLLELKTDNIGNLRTDLLNSRIRNNVRLRMKQNRLNVGLVPLYDEIKVVQELNISRVLAQSKLLGIVPKVAEVTGIKLLSQLQRLEWDTKLTGL
jgi:hypothetical protein